jgi:hypothetical protein
VRDGRFSEKRKNPKTLFLCMNSIEIKRKSIRNQAELNANQAVFKRDPSANQAELNANQARIKACDATFPREIINKVNANQADFKRNSSELSSALKRNSSGFPKDVKRKLALPPSTPP